MRMANQTIQGAGTHPGATPEEARAQVSSAHLLSDVPGHMPGDAALGWMFHPWLHHEHVAVFPASVQLLKMTSAYLKFLDEAIATYKQLVAKLQWAFGNVGATVEVRSGTHGSCPCSSSLLVLP